MPKKNRHTASYWWDLTTFMEESARIQEFAHVIFPLGIQECRYVATIDGTRDIHVAPVAKNTPCA